MMKWSALGGKAEEYGGLLLPLMFHKIPEEIRLSICNRVSKKNWSLEAVLKELKQEPARKQGTLRLFSSHTFWRYVHNGTKLPPVKKSGGKGPPSTSTLMAGSDGNQNPHVFTVARITHLLSVLLSPMFKSATKF